MLRHLVSQETNFACDRNIPWPWCSLQTLKPLEGRWDCAPSSQLRWLHAASTSRGTLPKYPDRPTPQGAIPATLLVPIPPCSFPPRTPRLSPSTSLSEPPFHHLPSPFPLSRISLHRLSNHPFNLSTAKIPASKQEKDIQRVRPLSRFRLKPIAPF